jgi:hypothetical protein
MVWQMSASLASPAHFQKKTILANSSTRQKWQIFGKYSNSLNLHTSGHSLQFSQFWITFDMRLIFIFRYYGEKKEDAAPNNPKVQQMSSAVLKPIITVTEFTPGNTPDKVNTKKEIYSNCKLVY